MAGLPRRKNLSQPYNDPEWLARRHGLGSQVEATTKAMRAALDAIAQAATGSRGL
jgi:hypothetical protein